MATSSASLSTYTPLNCSCGPNTNHLNLTSEMASRQTIVAFNTLHHLAQETGLSLHLPLYFTRQGANGEKETGYSVEILRSHKLINVEKIFIQLLAAPQNNVAGNIRISFERSEYTTMLHLTFFNRQGT